MRKITKTDIQKVALIYVVSLIAYWSINKFEALRNIVTM